MISQGRLERIESLKERKTALENELAAVNRQLEDLDAITEQTFILSETGFWAEVRKLAKGNDND